LGVLLRSAPRRIDKRLFCEELVSLCIIWILWFFADSELAIMLELAYTLLAESIKGDFERSCN